VELNIHKGEIGGRERDREGEGLFPDGELGVLAVLESPGVAEDALVYLTPGTAHLLQPVLPNTQTYIQQEKNQ